MFYSRIRSMSLRRSYHSWYRDWSPRSRLRGSRSSSRNTYRGKFV